MSEEKFSIEHDAGTIDYPGTTLLVGLDETGHEEFADPNHPAFGLGGCAMLLKDYDVLIDRPWRGMKRECFGGADVQLHASDLRNPTKQQLEALEYFFTHFQFFRFAVMAGSTVKNTTNAQLMQIVCAAVWGRIAEIAKWTQPTDVVVVAEQSDRTKKEVYGYLAGYEIGNETIRIKPRVFLAKKTAGQSFMEVADFVMHPAGAHVRNRLLGKPSIRQDFSAVFHKVDHRLSGYVELLQAGNPAQATVQPYSPASGGSAG